MNPGLIDFPSKEVSLLFAGKVMVSMFWDSRGMKNTSTVQYSNIFRTLTVWECVSWQSLNTFPVNYLPNFITSLDLTSRLNEIWRFFAVCVDMLISQGTLGLNHYSQKTTEM
jgi:hypothetical protein